MGNLTAAERSQVDRKNQIVKVIESGEITNRVTSLFVNDKDKAAKFKATLLNIALDQSLQNCSVASIIKSGLMLAELDLPLAKGLGQAYIVKYKAEAEAIIGYKGWLALAERSGKSVKAKPVFKCDEFDLVDNGFDETVIFKPNYDDREEFKPAWVKENLRGVLVSIRDNATKVVSNTFISVGKLNQIAGVSPSVKAGKYSPYTDWGLEMFQGKAIKYVLSKTAMNDTIGRAVEIDNRLDIKAIEDTKIEQRAGDVDLNAMMNQTVQDADVVESTPQERFYNFVKGNGLTDEEIDDFTEYANILPETIDKFLSDTGAAQSMIETFLENIDEIEV